jgi:hypothetical protein
MVKVWECGLVGAVYVIAASEAGLGREHCLRGGVLSHGG